jgi:uncharacterized alpha-E superfamily protein
MSRYLERAEHVARLLDVYFHLELDLRGLPGIPHEMHWTALAAILQQVVPAAKETSRSPQAALSNWLTFDLDNPNSILWCLARARYNARSIRGTLNSEMWKELNTLYLHLTDPLFGNQARESPHEFYQAVIRGSHAFQGVCDATLTQDEGWHFIRLGRLLERADKTARIVDIQYHLLQELTSSADWSLHNLEWAGVLRSCLAYEAYQKLYVGRVEPERVVEFLLLHPSFPRSVRHSLETAAQALAAIEGTGTSRALSKADRRLGRALCQLRYGDVDQILKGDLHVFLSGIQEHCAQAGRAIQDQYSLH